MQSVRYIIILPGKLPRQVKNNLSTEKASGTRKSRRCGGERHKPATGNPEPTEFRGQLPDKTP